MGSELFWASFAFIIVLREFKVFHCREIGQTFPQKNSNLLSFLSILTNQ